MGRSKKLLKLFVEFQNLKLVFIAKKDQVIGRLLKKLEKSFYDNFDLEDQPVFDKVTENGYLVSMFDIVGDVFENNSCIEVTSEVKNSSLVNLTQSEHRKIPKSIKRESSREAESKPRELKEVKDAREVKEVKEAKDGREAKESKEIKESKFEPVAKNLQKNEVPAKDLKSSGKRNEEKKVEAKDEEKKEVKVESGKGDASKDHKSESSAKKQKVQGGKVEYKIKVEDEKKGISNDNSKRDPLKTSSESESDSGIFTKDEKKPTLSKSNIFRS